VTPIEIYTACSIEVKAMEIFPWKLFAHTMNTLGTIPCIKNKQTNIYMYSSEETFEENYPTPRNLDIFCATSSAFLKTELADHSFIDID
jgi:hypothetical protein